MILIQIIKRRTLVPGGVAALSAVLVAMVLLLAVGKHAPPVHAVSFTVNSTVDAVDVNPGDGACATAAGECTLRAAIQETNALAAPDTISLPAGMYTLTIAGDVEDASATGDLDVTDDLTIEGAGAAITIIQACDSSGGPCTGIDRVLDVSSAVTVSIDGVTVRNGETDLVPNNGAGIRNNGTLILVNSAVSGNTASGSRSGGGIFNVSGAALILTDSTVSGNLAGGFGGGILNSGTATATNSTISNNSTVHEGGGIDNRGTLNLNNTTLSDNVAELRGGGIRSSTGTASLKNTIVANSTSVGDCSGTITSADHNLIEDTTGCTVTGDTTGNVTGQDPVLGPLADNGGPTQTHALLSGSPAIDAGSPDCPPPATDQRGVLRPQGTACDIGSFEAEVAGPPTIEGTSEAVAALSPASFKSGSPGLQVAMLSILSDIKELIDQGDTPEAVQKLKNLRLHLDGCGSSPDKNDWIVDCAAQLEMRALIDALIESLGG